jgi:hypothetical protein
LVWAFSILFLLHQKICPNIFFLRSSFGLGVFTAVFATPQRAQFGVNEGLGARVSAETGF